MHGTAAATAAMTDQQLMRRVQDNDDSAFEVLYDRHRDRVWRAAELLCRPSDRADKVVGDVYLAIWHERAAYDPARETVQAWTMRLLHRRAADPHRLQPATDRLPPRGSGDTSASDQAHQSDAPGTQGLPGLVDRLPTEQREIIALAFYGGLTHAQIAELLGLPPGTVKGRMRLGLHKLRGVMDEHDAGADPPG